MLEGTLRTCKAGFVLLTSDDLGRHKDESTLMQRARQNVIFELGYFIGSLGRDRICYIHKGNHDLLPGDLGNTVTIRFDGSINDKYMDIETELKKAGYVKS